MGTTRNACRILVEKALGKLKKRWEDNIKIDIREIGCENGKY
jgi:hypothetical protein